MNSEKAADLGIYINERKEMSKTDIINETLDDILGGIL